MKKKRTTGKKSNKKRPAKRNYEVTISPAQRKRVLTTLDALQKEAEDIALRIEGVQKTLCRVDFCYI